jgi:hypothetical protein
LTNTAIYSAGTAKETNYKFRVRYKKCVAKGGASTIDNIIATVLNDTSAADVVVIENDTDDADAAGRPGHHLEVVVLGGTADEIAQAIYKSKGGGIGLVGTNEKLVNDLGGHPHLVKWNSAEQVTIYFKIVLTISSLFPTDGEKQIKDNIIGYVGGTNSADEIIDGLKIGKSVIAVKIPKLIEIEGVEDAQITFGTAADPTTNSNIVMEYNQKAITGLSQVVISYNE